MNCRSVVIAVRAWFQLHQNKGILDQVRPSLGSPVCVLAWQPLSQVWQETLPSAPHNSKLPPFQGPGLQVAVSNQLIAFIWYHHPDFNEYHSGRLLCNLNIYLWSNSNLLWQGILLGSWWENFPFFSGVTVSVGAGSAQRHFKWMYTFHCVRNEWGYCSEPEYLYDTPQTAAN